MAKTKNSERSVETRLFIPITKVDAENRIVYGKMTAEEEDSSGEIWDYEGSKPYFEAWTANAEKTSGGKSLGNLRAMHQPIAAGKLTQFVMDDESRQVLIAAKVVDDAEWKKVEEGVYTGFSQGGAYVKRWKDSEDPSKTRYISDPVEVSLVDLPCLPSATFEYVKAGMTEIRKFNTVTKTEDVNMYEPTNEEVAARATEIANKLNDGSKWTDHLEKAAAELVAEHVAKTADGEDAGEALEDAGETSGGAAATDVADGATKAASTDPTGYVDQETKPKEDNDGESDVTKAEEEEDEEESEEEEDEEESEEDKTRKARDSLAQVWQTPDGRTFSKARDAVDHVLGRTSPPASPVDEALGKAREALAGGPEVAKLEPTEGLQEASDALSVVVEKGLWEAGRALEVLASVISIQQCAACEAEWEGDSSQVPQMFAEAANRLGEAALAMAQEEIAEALDTLRGDENGEVLVETIYAGAQAEFVKSFLPATLEKIGARNSARDRDTIQKMHDGAVELGAECRTEEEDDAEKFLAKMAENHPAIKAVLTQNAELREQVTTAVAGIQELTESITTMKSEMDSLRQQPVPMAPRTSVVDKRADNAPDGSGPTDLSKAEAMISELSKTQEGQRVLAEAAIRAAQASQQ